MRDIQRQIAEGADILRSHPRYDISTAELAELFNQAGVTDSTASTAYTIFNMGLSLGLAAGYRIAKSEAKKN